MKKNINEAVSKEVQNTNQIEQEANVIFNDATNPEKTTINPNKLNEDEARKVLNTMHLQNALVDAQNHIPNLTLNRTWQHANILKAKSDLALSLSELSKEIEDETLKQALQSEVKALASSITEELQISRAQEEKYRSETAKSNNE